jgi:hypothetical protein
MQANLPASHFLKNVIKILTIYPSIKAFQSLRMCVLKDKPHSCGSERAQLASQEAPCMQNRLGAEGAFLPLLISYFLPL